MQASDVISLARVELGEPDPTGRWSDTDLITLFNTASRAVGLRIEFPQGNISTTTAPNVQEYALPEINSVLRVYVAGQLCPQTTISSLEGDTLEMFDQSTPTFQPQWIAQVSSVYPVPSQQSGYPVGSALPWFPGMRPQYYLDRGGNIGLVPAPSTAVSLSIDIVPIPSAAAALSDESDFPFNFQEAIMWKMCHLAHKADNDDEQANTADQQFEKQIMLLNTWKRRLLQANATKLILFPERAKWKGPNR